MRNKARRLVILFGIVAIVVYGWTTPRLSGGQIINGHTLQLPDACNGFNLNLVKCWLRRPVSGSATATDGYYRNIRAITGSGSTLVRDTLDQFKARNGFAPSVGDVRAIYFNEGDLRLGRDMHCRQNGLKVACYVSNYGEPPFIDGAPNGKWPKLKTP